MPSDSSGMSSSYWSDPSWFSEPTDYSKINTPSDTGHVAKNWGTGFLSFDDTAGLSSRELLKGFGITDFDPANLYAAQTFDEGYGWKTNHIRQNMLGNVGKLMGTAGASIENLRDQTSSLASQSGLRRGRGPGLQMENIYNQYATGISDLGARRSDSVEGLKREWYEKLVTRIGAIEETENM